MAVYALGYADTTTYDPPIRETKPKSFHAGPRSAMNALSGNDGFQRGGDVTPSRLKTEEPRGYYGKRRAQALSRDLVERPKSAMASLTADCTDARSWSTSNTDSF